MLLKACYQTLYMVGLSLVFSSLGGIPLGVLLVITGEGGVSPRMRLNRLLAFCVNTVRSIPFIILMIALIPLTRFVVGSTIGTTASIVPLTIAAVPFVARIVESAIREVSPGVIEAAQAMGATVWQIIYKVMLREALPAIVYGLTITAINLVGYSAMAGVIGGGGLGDLAIRYGYQRFDNQIMLIIIIILVVLVQILQQLGDRFARRITH